MLSPEDIERRNQAINVYNDGVMLAKGEAGSSGQPDLKMAFRMMAASVDIDPTFVEGWYGLGNANGDMNLQAASIACMRRVVELEPRHLKAWVNLGHKLYHMGDHAGSRYASERALALDPDDPFALTNLSLVESIAGKNAKALSLARKAWASEQQRQTGDLAVQIQLAFALLYNGEWREGLEYFAARFKYKLHDHLYHPYPEWHGDTQAGSTLIVFADQGMGDALCFSRFLPLAAARVGRLVCVVHPELVTLFRALLQDTSNIDVMPLPAPYGPADFWTTLTSLPVALDLTNPEIEKAPWLRLPGFKMPPVWKIQGRALHVGICWAGNPQNDINTWRSTKFEQFLDLAQVPGVQLYSLQVGPEAQQLHLAGAMPVVRDLQPHIRDVTSTLAIMRELDLVITIESALGWIAAQADLECWIAYAYNGGDYRVGRSRQHPLWAPRTRIFKQGPDAQWQSVFDRICDAMRERVKRVGSLERTVGERTVAERTG